MPSEIKWQNFCALCSQIRIPVLANFWHWHSSFCRSHLSLMDSQKELIVVCKEPCWDMDGNSQKQHQFKLEAIAGQILSLVLVIYCWFWLHFYISKGEKLAHYISPASLPVGFSSTNARHSRRSEGIKKGREFSPLPPACCLPLALAMAGEYELLGFYLGNLGQSNNGTRSSSLNGRVPLSHMGSGSRVVAIIEANSGSPGLLQHWGGWLLTSQKMAAATALALVLF